MELIIVGLTFSFHVAYKYTRDLLSLDQCRPSAPVKLPPLMEMVNTPLDWRQWDACLADHPDTAFRDYIVRGIRQGFRIGYEYSKEAPTRRSLSNMSSARERPEVIREYLAEECSEGRVLGPFDPSRFPWVHTS